MENLDFSSSYEDLVTAEIMDWAIDEIPDQVKDSTLESLADKYWEAKLEDPDYSFDTELKELLLCETSNPMTDLEVTYGEQPYV
jgi:hypothetical protein|tara:strand:+ start:48 stop:299 length:252 start_codon:yes stop_codon:yes gene_type:complete